MEIIDLATQKEILTNPFSDFYLDNIMDETANRIYENSTLGDPLVMALKLKL